jgi:tetratricopeptide (TPR) repeat protein
MPRRDWFRSTDWDRATREAFFQRLSRSRSSGAKAQYLRIQAWHLQGTNDIRLLREAIELLELMFTQFPERVQLAQGHLQKAQCLRSLGDFDGAVVEYRAALEAERTFPNVKTDAWLDFGRFAVEQRRQELYAEVSTVLVEFLPTRGLAFPVDTFRLHGIRALIAMDRGHRLEALREARLAMEAANRPTSGLSRHPTVGLVDNRYTELVHRIAAIA